MIVTVTLNPSLDRTLELPKLERGRVLRTSVPTVEAGGKGVNVSRALTANAVPNIAVLPFGGTEGTVLCALLEADNIRCATVKAEGRTRSNLSLVEADGTVTKLNEPGNEMSTDVEDALAALVAQHAGPGDWIVLSGSVPAGYTAERFTAFARRLGRTGAHLAIDTSGTPINHVISAAPRLLKPNRSELAELTGMPVSTIAEVVTAATAIAERGIELVLVSIGGDGAVLIAGDRVLTGESRVTRVRSTVGAGDSFLAGFLSRFSNDESDLDSALFTALAWGAASASLPGSAVPHPHHIDPTRARLTTAVAPATPSTRTPTTTPLQRSNTP